MATDPVCGMDVRESDGLRLTAGGQAFFFCSRHCLEKFVRERGISPATGDGDVSCCVSGRKRPFYLHKTFLTASVIAGLLALSYGVPLLVPFRESFAAYFRMVWWAILLGIFLGGMIDHFVPRTYISHLLAQRGRKTILRAVGLGFFMSACSHGILALSMEIHKKGASNPAVVAFLLSSPWANLPLTIMLFGFFGVKALYLVLSAIVIAVITGFVYQWLEGRGWIETNRNSVSTEAGFSILADVGQRMAGYRFSFRSLGAALQGIYAGMAALGGMVIWWILIGMTIASAAGAYVPAHVFDSYIGPSVAGLLMTLVVATVIEVCSEGSAPMAFEIYRQTGAFGNSLVFLMAGVVTDYTEIGLLWHNVGKKTAMWLPAVTVPQVMLLGLLANHLFK
ncbi:MAG: permease [Candidatus Omnitrophica bacterium]|nr:permease [Candidatus Omnitrophota bacterium]MDD5670077.1 permease [Candidatus Omnitrophota bacterium]